MTGLKKNSTCGGGGDNANGSVYANRIVWILLAEDDEQRMAAPRMTSREKLLGGWHDRLKKNSPCGGDGDNANGSVYANRIVWILLAEDDEQRMAAPRMTSREKLLGGWHDRLKKNSPCRGWGTL